MLDFKLALREYKDHLKSELKTEQDIIDEARAGNYKSYGYYTILSSVDVDTKNNFVTVVLEEVKAYCTIERYRQVNYVRYPVYGPYKTKTKYIYESLKLDDIKRCFFLARNYQIYSFKDYIIAVCGCSMTEKMNYTREFVKKVFDFCLQNMEEQKLSEISNIEANIGTKISKIQNLKSNILNSITNLKTQKSNLAISQISIKNKISKIEKSNFNIALEYLSFGILGYLNSPKRYKKLKNKNDSLLANIAKKESQINEYLVQAKKLDDELEYLMRCKEDVNKNIFSDFLLEKKDIIKSIDSKEIFYL